jgi:type 1 glutamine amidotransferase
MNFPLSNQPNIFVTSAIAATLATSSTAAEKHLILIAGRDSHGPAAHEHHAGMRLFAADLAAIEGLRVTMVPNGWPEDQSIIDTADAVVFYADGLGGHPAIQNDRLEILGRRAAEGMGIGMIHFAVHVPVGNGSDEFKAWIGGYYESGWSCNPMWTAKIEEIPEHPITTGVEPFAHHDEWYFNMRFRDDMAGVTPILVAKPSDETRDGPYVHPAGPYPHIQAEKGRGEVLMWAVEREDGGRGFGFTGGHFHAGWDNPPMRRVVLNALVWVAGMEVPAGGVAITTKAVPDEESTE